MKLKYRLEKTTMLRSSVIKERIISEIKALNYEIESDDENLIVFRDNGWQITSRASQFNRIDSGIFELDEAKNKLNLIYTISITSDILIISFLILISIFINYGIFFLVIFFFISFLIRIPVAKTRCEEMFNKIIDDTESRDSTLV